MGPPPFPRSYLPTVNRLLAARVRVLYRLFVAAVDDSCDSAPFESD